MDDAAFFRHILHDLISQDGHTVVTAEDGQAALDVIAADPTPFDVILLDINMPRKDGFEVLAELKARGVLGLEPKPRILVITGESFQKPNVKLARDYGVAGFICKADPPDYTMARIRQELF